MTIQRMLGVRYGAAIALFAAVGSTAALPAQAGAVFGASSYSASFTFTDSNPSTTMTAAFDGTNFYTASGGSSGSPYAQYSASGNFIANSSPGIDFRSVFTDGSGNLYARGFADSTIYKQTAFGSFSPFLTLNGGSLDAQSGVVRDGAGHYVAQSGGVVSQWDASGNFIGSVTLNGFGANGEASYPQGRGIAAIGAYWLTYNTNNETLEAWSMAGNLLDSTVLNGAGTSFDSGFSYSYTDGMFFVADGPFGTWRGYDVGLGGSTVAVAEPGSLALLAVGLAGFAFRARRRD